MTTPQTAENHEATSRHEDPRKAHSKTTEGHKEGKDQTEAQHTGEKKQKGEKKPVRSVTTLHNGSSFSLPPLA